MLRRLYFSGFKFLGAVWLLAGLLCSSAVAECTDENRDCSVVGQWQFSLAIGLGGRTNPLLEGDDIPLFILPKVSYYGERFFWETTTLGFTLLESEHQNFNLVATVGFDQMYFNDWSIGNFVLEGGSFAFSAAGDNRIPENSPPSDMESTPFTDTSTPDTDDKDDGPNEFFHKPAFVVQSGEDAGTGRLFDIEVNYNDLGPRRMAGLAGIEYNAYAGNTAFSVQALQDFTSVHNGREIRLGVDHRLQVGGNAYTLAIGAVWQDNNIVDYYYGVDLDEVHYQELVYTPGSSLTPYLRFDWNRTLGKHWTLQASLQQKWFGSTITNSPLVDKHYSTSVFIGGVYHF